MPRGGPRPGQGRPNTLGDSKQVAIRLQLDVIEKLNAIAERDKITISEVIRRFIEKALG